MINGFIGKKLSMSNTFDDKGNRLTITRLSCSPLTVTQVKSQDTDKYVALQVAYGQKKRQNKAITGRLTKLKLDNISPLGFIEFKPTSETLPEAAGSITIDQVFSEGEKINVQAVSKGRGFAGVIKRWNFKRQPVSGGQSDRVRAPGSIGAQTPGKVLKGKKMPGHMGAAVTTIKNLVIHRVDPATNTLELIGSVPGHNNSWIILKKQ